MFKQFLITTALTLPLLGHSAFCASAPQTGAKKRNSVVIMADDVGILGISSATTAASS